MGQGKRWVAVAVLVVLAASAAGAAEAPQAQMHIRRVALFKNGLAMFTADLTLPEQGMTFAFRPPVAASHGSFWVNAGPQVKLTSLVAAKVSVDTQVKAASVAEFLAANVGRQVTLQMGGGRGRRHRGEAGRRRARRRRAPSRQDPYRPGGLPGASSYARPGQFALVETRSGYVAVNPQSVTRVELAEGRARARLHRAGAGRRAAGQPVGAGPRQGADGELAGQRAPHGRPATGWTSPTRSRRGSAPRPWSSMRRPTSTGSRSARSRACPTCCWRTW